MRKIVPFNNVLTFNTSVSEITAISLEHSLEKESDNISGNFYISGEYKMLNGGITPESFNFELPFDIALGTCYDMDSMVVDIDDFRYELIDNNKIKVNIDLYIDGEEVDNTSNELSTEELLINELNLTEDNDLSRQESKQVSTIEHNQESNVVIENEKIENSDKEGENDVMEEKSTNNEIVKETMEDEIKRESEVVKEFIYDNDFEAVDKDDNNKNDNNNHENNTIINNLNYEENYVTYKVYRIAEGDVLDSILAKYNVTKEELLSYNDNLTDLKVGDKLIIPFK